MPGYHDELIRQVKSWADRADLDNEVVAECITDAEDRFNYELRVKEMVQQDIATVTDSIIPMPCDCLEVDYIRFAKQESPVEIVRGGFPIHYVSRDEYFTIVNDTANPKYKFAIFTYLGGRLMLNPNLVVSNSTKVEIGYYHKVLPLSESDTVLYENYQRMYRFATLGSAAAYLTEDDRVPIWEANATALIQKANDAWSKSKSSGGPLNIRYRSFG